jgi:alpha-galactosidase
MSRKLHRFERNHITVSPKPRRVLYNSWEATAFNVDVQEQKKLADKAAQMGVELFVVDDGWFGERHSDMAGLGDWQVNKQKFPHGLGELIGHANGLSMDFGIWVEPEAVNPDSELYRSHPDWIYHLDGIEPLKLRNQYVLNITRQPVRQYIKDMLYDLLRTNPIRFLKWDMNRSLSDLGEGDRQLGVEHVHALYEIWSELRRDFPHVELETCAGGGGRIDLGILRYAAECWPSDNTDPFDRLYIQEDFTQFYAPQIMMCWVTDTHALSNKANRSIAYKFHSAMCGGLGIGANINRLSQEELDEYKTYIELYKEIRQTILFGDLYRLLPPHASSFSAVEYISPSHDEIVVLAFLHTQQFGDSCSRLKLQGLQKSARYELLGEGKSYYGSTLMHYGLPITLKGDFESALLRLRRVK